MEGDDEDFGDAWD